jgi:hypothetical protein
MVILINQRFLLLMKVQKQCMGVLKLNRIHSLSINCQLDLQCIWQNGKTHIIIWLWNMGTWEHRNNWKGSNKIL